MMMALCGKTKEKEPLIPLDDPVPLSSLDTLGAQYRRSVPENCQRMLAEDHKSWWRCGCGQINPEASSGIKTSCISCGASLTELLESARPDTLRLRQNAYEKEQLRLEHERKKKQKQKILLISGYMAALIVAIAVMSTIRISAYNTELAELQARRDELILYSCAAQLVAIEATRK